MSDIQQIIETAFERRAEITPANADAEVRNAVNEVLGMLDSGKARVAEKQNGDWVVNQWLKKAVLLSFRLNDNRPMSGGETQYFDKVEPKFANFTEADFNTAGVRVVPPAAARRGSYIAPGVVLMPSYVNIGAYVDSGTMVDTWAT
ncbi:MAG TPA: 2,3,4,5-tetrahydropyridine-2,6-dicarboxylate N-succinyltransferase, partial [Methylophaga sp.]|nr:2,3,4,5-tetrahydropyridine-2,6-dicarboxylate N-succinyltransferase [Methylophaga sp.]